MKDTLIGIVLGDGYLEPHGRGVRLQVIHSAISSTRFHPDCGTLHRASDAVQASIPRND
jgi:hypothetical protein